MQYLTLFCLVLINKTQSANILGIFPVPTHSHFILGNALMKGLAENGHNVTLISGFTDNVPSKNGSYRDVVITGFWQIAEERREKLNYFKKEDISPFLLATFLTKNMMLNTESCLRHPNVQELIHSNEKFDVVIIEQFLNDAFKAFATQFNAPLILFSTIGANYWVNSLVGNPAPISYIPGLFLNYSNSMSFSERLTNGLMYIFNECISHFYIYPTQAAMVKKYFPNSTDLYEVLYNASIVLLNSHESTNQPVPHVPNMINIGGFHISPPKKLPKDLQHLLDNAKNGVIYFSMGSTLKSSSLPLEKREAFLKTFAKLKETILWKWENDILDGKPDNVIIRKWFPQQDILAHPNVKLFITHGGLLSTTETIYHGVPVLVIPVYGDQKLNAQNIVHNGYGLSLNFQQVTENHLKEKLNLLLTDARFALNAKTRSKIFHDRSELPMETAKYWVEYVIRHKGAKHLRVSGVDVPFFHYLLLDMILAVSLIAVIIVVVCYFLFRKLYLLCTKTFKVEQKAKMN